MDIGLMSMALSQGKVKQQVSVSVLKKAMGNADQQSKALQKLMSTADAKVIQPNLGANIDLKL